MKKYQIITFGVIIWALVVSIQIQKKAQSTAISVVEQYCGYQISVESGNLRITSSEVQPAAGKNDAPESYRPQGIDMWWQCFK